MSVLAVLVVLFIWRLRVSLALLEQERREGERIRARWSRPARS